MRRLWDRIPSLVRAFGIVALIALVVVVLFLEPSWRRSAACFRSHSLAIAFFLFLLAGKRGDLEAWSEWNRKLLYAAIVLAVVDIGLALGLGFPAGVGAFAFLVVLAACGFVVFRVWRIEHRF